MFCFSKSHSSCHSSDGYSLCPVLHNFSRQASLTHAEKFRVFSDFNAHSICSSMEWEKRIFFVMVLLVRGFAGIHTPV